MFKIVYFKPNQRFLAKSVKVEKNYKYVKYIFRSTIKRVNGGKKLSRRNEAKRQLSLRVAPREPPSRDEIIDRSQKYKRIKLQLLLTVGVANFTCSKLTHSKVVLTLLEYF